MRTWNMLKARANPGISAFVVLTLLLAGAVAIINGSPAQAQTEPVPFDPNLAEVYISQEIPTRMYIALTDDNGIYAFDDSLGSPEGNIGYNTLGFDFVTSNFMYAVGNNGGDGLTPRTILKIGRAVDANGNPTDINVVTPYLDANGNPVILEDATDGPSDYNAGTFGDDGLFYATASAGNKVAIVDINGLNGPAGAVRYVDLNFDNATIKALGPDIVLVDGFLWSLTQSNMQRIDPATGEVRSFEFPIENTLNGDTDLSSTSFGAAWVFGNGAIGISNNVTGLVSVIEIKDAGSDNPTFREFNQVQGPGSSNNDATNNPGPPIDLELVKTGSKISGATTGPNAQFTLKVTNKSPYRSSGYLLEDILPAELQSPTTTSPGCVIATDADGVNILRCTGGQLEGGESIDVLVQGTVDPLAVDCVANNGAVIGNELDPDPNNNTGSATLCADLAITKSAELVNEDTVKFTVSLQNTGDLDYSTTSPASFIDDLSGVLDDLVFNNDVATAYSGASNPADAAASLAGTDLTWTGPLEVGETATITYSATLPEPGTLDGDLSADNEACINVPLINDCDTTKTGFPNLMVSKSSDPVSGSAVVAGQAITYTLTFDNTTGAELAAVDAVDDLTGVIDDATVTAEPVSSDPSLTVTPVTDGKFTIQGSVAAGAAVTVNLTVTVNADDARNDNILENFLLPPNTETPDICVSPDPTCTVHEVSAMTLTKVGMAMDSNESGKIEPGEMIDYTITVTNTGETTLSDVTVVDSIAGATTCDVTTLEPGQSATCTASYTTTQADVDAKFVTNTATGTSVDPSGNTLTADDTTTTPLEAMPDISVVKSADEGDLVVGDVVDYTIIVTNTGNVTLSDVVLDDPLTDDETCPKTVLVAGEAMTCTSTYVITQADVDAGKIDNTATGTGTDPEGTMVDDSSSVTFPLKQTPDLVVEKSGVPVDTNGNGVLEAGETIDYTVKATNAGNTTLTNLVVVDSIAGATTCDKTTLAPGEFATCTATYTLTQADVDERTVVNTATGTATDPEGNELTDDDTVTTPLEAMPDISVVKSAAEGELVVGDVVDYTIVVTNTGNVTLSDVVLDDPLTDDETCPKTVLEVGEAMTCTSTYVITQPDVDAGRIDNTATGTGTDPEGTMVDDSSSVTFPLKQTPDLVVEKTGVPVDTNGNDVLTAGETIDYTIKATNAGNTTLTDLVVVDSIAGATTCDKTTLAPGEIATCTATYTLTQADVDNGMVTNTATGTATDPDGNELTDDDTVTTPIPGDPKINVVKSGSVGELVVGQTINYTIVVTNTGNVTLTDVVLDDPLTSDETCPKTVLVPAESMTCTSSYVITQADVDAGQIDNTATATGTDPTGKDVTDDGSTTFPFQKHPALVVDKHQPKGNAVVGGVLKYYISVTNTGNVTLTDLKLVDSLTTDVTCDVNVLAPGQMANCYAVYTVTQADLAKCKIVNTALATANDPDGIEVKAGDTVETPCIPPPPPPKPTPIPPKPPIKPPPPKPKPPLAITGATSIPVATAAVGMVLLGLTIVGFARPRRKF